MFNGCWQNSVSIGIRRGLQQLSKIRNFGSVNENILSFGTLHFCGSVGTEMVKIPVLPPPSPSFVWEKGLCWGAGRDYCIFRTTEAEYQA